MTLAETKRKWFDQKRLELHGRGMKDAHIAEQMGIKRAYFSQVVNGMAVSDQVIDRMCSAFAFKFIPNEQVAKGQTPGTVTVSQEMWDELMLQAKTNTRLLNALMDKMEGK